MKTIANVATNQEAQAVRIKLGAFDIEVFIPDETSATVVPHFFGTPSGVRVQVADEDEERALEALASE